MNLPFANPVTLCQNSVKHWLEALNDEVSGKEYRGQLMNYYHSLIALQDAAYETSNEIKGALNEEQKQVLENEIADICPYYDGNSSDEE